VTEGLPPLSFELEQFLAARLTMHRPRFTELGEELANALLDETTPNTNWEASKAVESYVADRCLIEATKLLDDDGAFRRSLVHALALAAVGTVIDAAGTQPGAQPLDAAPEEAMAILERAYALVAG
jgi:hypothetical protein